MKFVHAMPSSASLLLLVSALGACDKTPPPPPPDTARSTTTAAAEAKPGEKTGGTVRASGSSALQPLVNAAKEKFEAEKKGASIELSAGGSKKGLADVSSGAVQIGNSDIFAPEDLKASLVDHRVAVVGFAAMANKGPYNEKVAAVSLVDLAKVFQGTIKDWKELGGQPQPIVVINRAPGSGTRTVFGNAVLGGDKFVESKTEDNSGALVDKLKQTKGAISYLALSFKDDALLTLSIKGDAGVVEPTDANIASGAYPVWSYEHMYTKGEATGLTKDFLDFVVSPAFQTGGLTKVKGFVAITAMKVTKEKD